jgi:hypothetical protein
MHACLLRTNTSGVALGFYVATHAGRFAFNTGINATFNQHCHPNHQNHSDNTAMGKSWSWMETKHDHEAGSYGFDAILIVTAIDNTSM